MKQKTNNGLKVTHHPLYSRYIVMKQYAKRINLEFEFLDSKEFLDWCDEHNYNIYCRFVRKDITKGFTKDNLIGVFHG